MDYKSKYLKYKKRYINLQIINGGFDKNVLEKELVDFINAEITILNNNNNNIILIEKNNVYLNTGKKILLTWNNIKTQTDKIKKILFDFRKKIVDEIIKKIFNVFPDCEMSNCLSNASGSIGPEATLDSDYDLTITGHYKVSEMIQIFNSVIDKVFKVTPSEVFDTNLYGYSFLIPEKASQQNRKIWDIDKIGKYTCLLTNEKKSSLQDTWAYLRLLSFCYNHNDIFNFKNIDINNFYIKGLFEYDKNPKQKAIEYIKKMNIFEKSITTNTDIILEQSYDIEKLITTNTNIKQLDYIENIKQNIINSLSYMNYYGDETYFTQGAFMHVVGTMFYYKNESASNKIKILKPYYLIHSMIENLAYFIHAYEKNKDIIYAIKYYHRFFDAFYLFMFQKNTQNSDLENKLVTNLENILKNLDFIKSKLRNRTDDEIKIEMEKEKINKSIPEYKLLKENELKENINSNILKIIKINSNDTNFYINSLIDILIYCIKPESTNIQIIKNNNNTYDISIKN